MNHNNHIFRDGEGVIHDMCQRCGASQVDQRECAPSGIHLPPIGESRDDCAMMNYSANAYKN
jgi:hypothetical protein